MDLVDFFHKKYYPDLSVEQVAAAFGNPKVVDAAYNHVQKKYYPDLPPEKVKRIPIIVNNPNDPRLKAYNDSLSLYNKSLKSYNSDLKSGAEMELYFNSKIPEKDRNRLLSGYKDLHGKPLSTETYQSDIPGGGAPSFNGKYDANMNPNNDFPAPKVKQKIMPIGGNASGERGAGWVDLYAKPVQPYKYKPTYEEFVKTANPDYIGDDYDLEAAYKNLPLKTMQAWAKDPEKNHLPDTYKKPNHPTFSNESMYYKEGMPAVKWEGDKAIPINQPQQEADAPVVYKSKKQTYQGRAFMEATGLRPGLYHPEEVFSAKKKQSASGKLAF